MEDDTLYEGEVIWFNAPRGFGFVKWEKDGVAQKDMFAHFSDIQMDGFRQLKAGQKVTFYIGVNHNNEPKAIEIQVSDE